jgi:hypothetical protein
VVEVQRKKARRPRHSIDSFYSGGPRRRLSHGAHPNEQPAHQPDDEPDPVDQMDAISAKLLDSLGKQPGDTPLLIRSAETLAKVAVARHRISPRPSRDLSENLARVLNRFGDLIVPPDN